MSSPPAAPEGSARESPADLLALGLGGADTQVDLEHEVDLERFLVECPDLELHGCLGRGGMGLVYRARQIRLDRVVAVKLMAPRLASDPEFAERFEREARALARLDHPGVVRVHEFGEAAGVYYLVMEYVDGANLRELMAQDIAPDDAAEIIGQLCDALAYAHARGVVHRDIKPENVLLERGGRVKVADFGLAKLQQEPGGATATRTRRIVGTPQYMAPEQLGDPGAVDHRADIFAIGVVFYEMLTGQLPVGRFDSPSELGRGDARLDAIVLRALESNRDKRFQSATEIGQALASRHDDGGHPTVPAGATPIGAVSPLRRPRRWIAGAVVATGLVAAAGVAMVVAREALPVAAVDVPPASVGSEAEPEPEPAPPSAAPSGDVAAPSPSPSPSLTRWPARELAALDANTGAVVGIDWSELRQAPALEQLGPTVFADAPPTWQSCRDDVLDRTYKILVALDKKGEPQQLRIHGDWEPAQLEACLPALSSTRHGPDLPRRDHPAPSPVVASVDIGPHKRFRIGDPDSTTPKEFIVAKRGSSILVTFDTTLSEAELDGLLAAPPTNTRLRDEVFSRMNLAAPIFVFAALEEGTLPIAMQSFEGQIELWEKLGLDATVHFADEAAAAGAKTLIDSYANIAMTVPDFEEKPEVEVVQDGTKVRVRATFRIPEPKQRGEVDGRKLGFTLNFGPTESDQDSGG